MMWVVLDFLGLSSNRFGGNVPGLSLLENLGECPAMEKTWTKHETKPSR